METAGQGFHHHAEPNGRRLDVERRAYEIYQARGGSHGSDLDDWLQAERELRQREPAG
jgi:hypothetical protein